jgi:hypothetical protein
MIKYNDDDRNIAVNTHQRLLAYINDIIEDCKNC